MVHPSLFVSVSLSSFGFFCAARKARIRAERERWSSAIFALDADGEGDVCECEGLWCGRPRREAMKSSRLKNEGFVH